MMLSLKLCEVTRHGGTYPSAQEAGAGGWCVTGHLSLAARLSQKGKESDEMLITMETVRVKVSCSSMDTNYVKNMISLARCAAASPMLGLKACATYPGLT